MESDEEPDHITDWTQLDSMKAFEWVENKSSPISKILQQSPAYSMNTDHIDSSTKLADNTPSIRDNFIDQLATKATAPVSLLVESLVQQLCSMIEPDHVKAEHLYKTICKQLHHMNLIDETFKMTEFDVMRSQYQRALYQLAAVASGQTEGLDLQVVWPLTDPTSRQWSRYYREFEELNFVAGGGFGRVYRARNKLDGIEYAIKKVTIKYRTISRVLPHLKEVKTFAGLNHNNIVPFKAAWLEPLFDDPTTTRAMVTDSPHVQQKHLANKKRSHGKRVSKITAFSKALEVAVYETESKFSATTTTIEEEEIDEEEESDSESESSDSSAEPHTDQRNHLQLPVNNRADESSDFIQFQRSTPDDVVDGANMSAMESPNNKHLVKPNENRPNNNLIKGSLEFNESQPHLKLKWATLYIQMTFRPLTLRAWLDERNKNEDFCKFYQKFIKKSVQQWDRTVVDDDDDDEDDAINKNGSSAAVTKFNELFRRRSTNPIANTSLAKNLTKNWNIYDVTLNIFTQTLNGLRYIHEQNIVHHDIKPSNIFIGCEKNGDLYVQLGDFGLACPLETKHSPDSMFGTPTYAAPEQLNGHCNPKSDVYSLGIILLELLIPFQTDMERLKTFDAARKEIFPPNIPPKFLTLLKTLLQRHNKRPNADETFKLLTELELWNGNCEHSSQSRNNDLQNQLTQVTDELNQLKMQLATPISPNNDCSNDSSKNIPDITIECSNFESSTNQSFTCKLNINAIDDEISECPNEYDDKDQQIRILTNKLSESDKEAMELRKEVERLRDIIKQTNG